MSQDVSEAEVFAPDGALPQPWTFERPYTQLFRIANPAAGAQTELRVIPGNTWERLQCLHFRLKASATVATRLPVLTYNINNDGLSSICEVPAASNVVAGEDRRFSFFIGASTIVISNNTRHISSLPSFVLQPGMELFLAVGGIQVGDQLSEISIVMDRWDSGPLHDPGPTEDELRILATTYRIIQEGRRNGA